MSETETKKPNVNLYVGLVFFILFVVIVIWFMPSEEESEIKQPEPVVVKPQVLQKEQPVEAEQQETTTPKIEPVVVDTLEPEQEMAETLVEEEAQPVAMPDITEIVEPEPAVEAEAKDDSWILSQLDGLLRNQDLLNLFVSRDLVSNFVVFVDNTARGQFTPAFSPVKKPEENFSVKLVAPSTYQMTSESSFRYNLYAQLFLTLPTEQSLAVYSQLADEMNQAHENLGYESGSFNDKLLSAIDMIVSTPTLTDNPELVAPSAMYQFKDPELEQLQPIQKLFLRLGNDNQEKIKSKLLAFKSALQN